MRERSFSLESIIRAILYLGIAWLFFNLAVASGLHVPPALLTLAVLVH